MAATALFAQEGPRFGLQLGLNLPQSDLKDAVDSKVGFNVGAQTTFGFSGGHMLRPRLDYAWFPEYTESYAGATSGVKISSLGLGADYLYFVEGRPQGFYITGGLSAVRWKLEVSASYLGSSFSDSEDTTKLGAAVGVGYQFNRTVGAEVRYLKSRAWEADMDLIQVGATFRF